MSVLALKINQCLHGFPSARQASLELLKRFSSRINCIAASAGNKNFIEKPHFKLYSTTPLPQACSRVNVGKASHVEKFRCSVTDPALHSMDDVSLFYQIPNEFYCRMATAEWNTLAFSHRFQKLSRIFNENCMMIRKPGIEIINMLEQSDYNSPVNRFLLYGSQGCGKSMLLQYAVHYALLRNWLIVPTYHTWNWVTYHHRFKEHKQQEHVMSQWNAERIDQPERAAEWLKTFRLLNKPLLLQLKTTKDYVWSKHETTKEGSSFSQLVDTGIARIKIASDVIGALMREIRLQNSPNFPRTLVVTDCVNALFGNTRFRLEYGVQVESHQLTFVHHMKKMLSNQWKNGAVITALDRSIFSTPDLYTKPIYTEHPYDCLSKEGFDCLDPHIPVHVPPYTDGEMLTQLAYYIDNKWLTGKSLTEAGEAELFQLSSNNPISRNCLHVY